MQYAETLREVKKAESEVRDLKADAQRQATQILRDAERQANQLLEAARKEADAAYSAALDKARAKADSDRKTRLTGGERDAAMVRNRASGAESKAAVGVILANFEKRISGK